ncbi:MAG: hypothetical protein AB1505_35205 [Candidatus Latescibacterota bacterium]
MRAHIPDDVLVRTPLPAIDRSFGLAVELIDQLRDCAARAGCREGYCGVSDGRVNPCHAWDSRDWDHANKVYGWLDRDVEIAVTLPGGRRLGYTFRCAADRRSLLLRSTPTGVLAHVRLPFCGAVQDVRQGDRPVPWRAERRMDTDFVCFDAVLDGRPIAVSLAPPEVRP